MDYNRIYKFFIFTFLIFITSCYHPFLESLFHSKRTIEVRFFSELFSIPNKSISFDFKKQLEDFIVKRHPTVLVENNGDGYLEGTFVDQIIYTTKDNKSKTVKISVIIRYRDYRDHKKSWEKKFVVSRDFPINPNDEKDDTIPEETFNKIMEQLVLQVYYKTFH